MEESMTSVIIHLTFSIVAARTAIISIVKILAFTIAIIPTTIETNIVFHCHVYASPIPCCRYTIVGCRFLNEHYCHQTHRYHRRSAFVLMNLVILEDAETPEEGSRNSIAPMEQRNKQVDVPHHRVNRSDVV